MVGRDPARPCEYDLEDGFSLNFDLVVGNDDTPQPLPQPGQAFDVEVHVARRVSVPSAVRVVRHERPFVVVSIAPKGPLGAELRSFGGILRVELAERVEGLAKVESWVP